MATTQHIEAPLSICKIDMKYDNIFLAGSISNAHDWQVQAASVLLPHFNVFNPRRKNFDVLDKNAEREQITWEHTWLERCDIILFYFSYETVAPITLLEYGAALESTKANENFQKIYGAIHPDYSRKNDVIIQTELRNPKWSKNITFDLSETLEQIIKENI